MTACLQLSFLSCIGAALCMTPRSSAQPVVAATPIVVLRGHSFPLGSLAYSVDGEKILSAGDSTIRLWDVKTGKVLRTLLKEENGIGGAAFSLDRKRVAVIAGAGGTELHFLDVPTGKELPALKLEEGSVNGLALSSDGKLVASSRNPTCFCLQEVATGKVVKEWDARKEGTYGLAFSPDSRFLVSASLAGKVSDGTVRLWELRASRPRVVRETPLGGRVHPLIFAPNGRLVLALQYGGPNFFLWDTATPGSKFQEVPVAWPPWDTLDRLPVLSGLAISPDCRVIAVSGNDGLVRLFELATHKEGVRWRGGESDTIAFAPDGRTLATNGTKDFSIQVWDRAALCRPSKGGEPTAEELQNSWDDLGDTEAARGFRAVWTLVAAPAKAVRLCEKFVCLGSTFTPVRVRQLIAQLDDRRYAVRHEAAHELQVMGERTVPCLQEVLDKTQGLELRRRVEDLLKLLDGPFSPTQVRRKRLVEVLEHLNTPQARQLLKRLAAGALGDPAARDAAESLERLAKRPPAD